MSSDGPAQIAAPTVIAILTVPAYVLFSFLFFVRRHKEPIRSRLPEFVYVSNFYIITFSIDVTIRMIWFEEFPCMVHLWFVMAIFPLYGNCWIIRQMYLIYRFHLTQARLRFRDVGLLETQMKARSDSNASNDDTMSELDKEEASNFWFRFRFVLQKRYMMIVFFAIALVFAIGMIIFGFATGAYESAARCEEVAKPFYFVVGGGAFIYTVSISYLRYVIRNVREGFDMKFELNGVFSSSIVVIIVWLAVFVAAKDPEWWTTIPLYFAFPTAFFFSTVLQVWNSYKLERALAENPSTRSREGSIAALDFRSVLEGQEYYEHFKEFLTIELCVENLLFYEAVLMYERLENPELQLAEAKKIQAKFLDNGSQYQVNIDYELVNTIRDNIAAKNVDKQTFEDAKQWIYELMRTDSYPRFTRSLIQKLREETTLPVSISSRA